MKKNNPPLHILVTGGTGFIGTHLVNELVRRYQNAAIDIVDDLSNSSVSEARKEFFQRHGINFYKAKVGDFESPPGRKYDFIFHLASPVGPVGVLKYAGRMGAMIVNDAVKMAQLALCDQAKLLCISTSEVYGSHPENNRPQHEDLPKIVPANVTVRLEYGTGKLLMEIVLLNLMKVEPLHVNFIRPFNIIGPYQKGEVGFVVPRFVQAALANEPLTVFGDGLQKRTFTHVSDIVRPMIDLMNTKYRGKIYNVGNPANICSITELAERIVRVTHSSSEIHYVDPKKIYGSLFEEAWNKIPDVTRITHDLGWKPEFYLDEILQEYVDFARGKLDFENPQFANIRMKSR